MPWRHMEELKYISTFTLCSPCIVVSITIINQQLHYKVDCHLKSLEIPYICFGRRATIIRASIYVQTSLRTFTYHCWFVDVHWGVPYTCCIYVGGGVSFLVVIHKYSAYKEPPSVHQRTSNDKWKCAVKFVHI
jgi:hypothetical protein